MTAYKNVTFINFVSTVLFWTHTVYIHTSLKIIYYVSVEEKLLLSVKN